MPGKSCKASLITGRTGVWPGAGTVSTSGVRPLPWNSLMAAMAGSGSYWMVNWPPCIPVAALKEALTVQVNTRLSFIFTEILRATAYVARNHPPTIFRGFRYSNKRKSILP